MLSEQYDIGIIPFKRSQNKYLLNFLAETGRKQLPADSLNIAGGFKTGDKFFICGFHSFYHNWTRHKTPGLSQATVKTGQSKMFIVSDLYLISQSGSPVFSNDRIIGMLTQIGHVNSTVALLKNPYQTAKTARVIKGKYIMQLLQKLRKQEKKS